MCERFIALIDDSKANSKNHAKKILEDLKKYLKGVISMQDTQSNTAYVVPLKGNSIVEHDISKTYHCPVRKGFLKYPANYLGFRFGGKLQYINHVENY